ncbi:GspH/FimT family pseudopilin [Oceanicaulis sp. MMSF_3324]|uniref:GspH/FimT family pseudopilin n=1 Tax=Oceanicaulis sp. MMSF_3324 TaxID=3046702 RepID=UPI00273ED155|nr:GspH/FimT family pseudopilin [Oceanicaulis sp. MMSF_3324]
MPLSSRSSQAGVSLIETLAALAIIALVTGVAVVMLQPEDSPAQVEGEALVRVLNEARQEALVSGQHVGFGARFDGRGYQFYRFEEGAWRVRTDHPAFDAHRFEDRDLFLSVQSGAIAQRSETSLEDSGETLNGPEVWFDPTGFDQPFAYELRGPEAVRQIARNGAGRLTLVDPQAETPS